MVPRRAHCRLGALADDLDGADAVVRLRARADERPFRDVEIVVLDSSSSGAKTAMRALGKYAPLDLVKELARANVEPTLGGRPADVTVMFSDIEGFTSLAERAEPGELADRLGAYLEAMTGAIRSTGGTIDKFIGDAVMALWNAPSPVEHHPRQACRAVLACMNATRVLYASSRWSGPPLVTRFGVNTDRVLVGHFGAPARFSYTALGDGVNLTARLEALCKQYGVTALVSEAVARGGRRGVRVSTFGTGSPSKASRPPSWSTNCSGPKTPAGPRSSSRTKRRSTTTSHVASKPPPGASPRSPKPTHRRACFSNAAVASSMRLPARRGTASIQPRRSESLG